MTTLALEIIINDKFHISFDRNFRQNLESGAAAWSVACPLRKHLYRDPPSRSAHSFMEKIQSSAYSRRTSFQLLEKEWTPNTGKLPRNNVVKELNIPI